MLFKRIEDFFAVPGKTTKFASSKHWELPLLISPDGGIGRPVGLKHQCPKGCAGSTPAPGTKIKAK